MKKNSDLLKEQIKPLEQKLKQKERLLKQYREALDNSNARIERIAKELDESLFLIREIHKTLLPVKLPHIPGFEFSYKFLPTKQAVSGDFFDVVKIKNSMNFGILLASCSTYAVTSLFLSSFLKSSPYLKNYKRAKDFLSFLAKKIPSSFLKKEKIHLFYGIVSRSSLELDYCLVGDIFVGYKTPGKELDVLPSCTPHLYKQEKIQLKGEKILLQPKDILLLCSPGVAQRTNARGKKFGEDNIVKAVSKKRSAGVLEIRQNVLFSCNEFGRGTVSTKDCTVLSVQVTRPTLKVQSSLS